MALSPTGGHGCDLKMKGSPCPPLRSHRVHPRPLQVKFVASAEGRCGLSAFNLSGWDFAFARLNARSANVRKSWSSSENSRASLAGRVGGGSLFSSILPHVLRAIALRCCNRCNHRIGYAGYKVLISLDHRQHVIPEPLRPRIAPKTADCCKYFRLIHAT